MLRSNYFYFVFIISLFINQANASELTLLCKGAGYKTPDVELKLNEKTIIPIEIFRKKWDGRDKWYSNGRLITTKVFLKPRDNRIIASWDGNTNFNFKFEKKHYGKGFQKFNGKLLPNGKLMVPGGDDWSRLKWKCNMGREEVLALIEESQQKVMSASSATSSELTTSEEKTKRLEAELSALKLQAEIAALKAEQQKKHQSNNKDTSIPQISQLAFNIKGKQGTVSGMVRDDSGIAEVTIDGSIIQLQSDGRFEYQTFVPSNGIRLKIVATNMSGLSSEKFIALERSANSQTASITFDRLNPLGKKVRRNDNAIALVVGIANYENTPAKAIYADSDALMFRDYASEKLGIPENRIKTMVNDKADERELLLSVKSWLARSVRQDQTDVYIFFAGHGLASEDGENMYLLPHDGAPELLDDTAIMRNRLFADIASSGPRSVTVFFDTCYSGTTRGPDMLIASRPIALRAKGSSIPDGFTVFTAAGGDQTAKPLEEAKHGMFSYFLMKGMEGDADSNQDNQITAAELHEYVEQNVVRQSGGSQVPELQGDANRILVSFQ